MNTDQLPLFCRFRVISPFLSMSESTNRVAERLTESYAQHRAHPTHNSRSHIPETIITPSAFKRQCKTEDYSSYSSHTLYYSPFHESNKSISTNTCATTNPTAPIGDVPFSRSENCHNRTSRPLGFTKATHSYDGTDEEMKQAADIPIESNFIGGPIALLSHKSESRNNQNNNNLLSLGNSPKLNTPAAYYTPISIPDAQLTPTLSSLTLSSPSMLLSSISSYFSRSSPISSSFSSFSSLAAYSPSSHRVCIADLHLAAVEDGESTRETGKPATDILAGEPSSRGLNVFRVSHNCDAGLLSLTTEGICADCMEINQRAESRESQRSRESKRTGAWKDGSIPACDANEDACDSRAGVCDVDEEETSSSSSRVDPLLEAISQCSILGTKAPTMPVTSSSIAQTTHVRVAQDVQSSQKHKDQVFKVLDLDFSEKNNERERNERSSQKIKVQRKPARQESSADVALLSQDSSFSLSPAQLHGSYIPNLPRIPEHESENGVSTRDVVGSSGNPFSKLMSKREKQPFVSSNSDHRSSHQCCTSASYHVFSPSIYQAIPVNSGTYWDSYRNPVPGIPNAAAMISDQSLLNANKLHSHQQTVIAPPPHITILRPSSSLLRKYSTAANGHVVDSRIAAERSRWFETQEDAQMGLVTSPFAVHTPRAHATLGYVFSERIIQPVWDICEEILALIVSFLISLVFYCRMGWEMCKGAVAAFERIVAKIFRQFLSCVGCHKGEAENADSEYDEIPVQFVDRGDDEMFV